MGFASHNYWLNVESDSKVNWLGHLNNMKKLMVKTRERRENRGLKWEATSGG
jgi:hypothetical protein